MITADTPIPTSDPLLRKAIHIAFGGRCFYTGREVGIDEMHIDHITPKSSGGKDCIHNYVLSCGDLNLRKSSSTHDSLLVVAIEANTRLFSPKVVDVLRAFVQCGQYPRPRGRPEKPADQKRTGRLPFRVFLDVEEKAKLLGRDRIEEIIRRAKLPPLG